MKELGFSLLHLFFSYINNKNIFTQENLTVPEEKKYSNAKKKKIGKGCLLVWQGFWLYNISTSPIWWKMEYEKFVLDSDPQTINRGLAIEKHGEIILRLGIMIFALYFNDHSKTELNWKFKSLYKQNSKLKL